MSSGKPELTIEQNIPVPRRCPPRTAAAKVAHAMKDGDSVLCTSPTDVNRVVKIIRESGGCATSRKCEGGWRVWRITADKKGTT